MPESGTSQCVSYANNMMLLGLDLLLDIGRDNDSMPASEAGIGMSSNHDGAMEGMLASHS